MFVTAHPEYPRTRVERVFKFLYMLLVVVLFSSVVVTVTSFADRVGNTFDSYWGADSYVLPPALSALLQNCTYSGSFTVHGMKTPVTFDVRSSTYGFVTMTAVILGVFILEATLVLFATLGSLLFSYNIRHMRIYGWHIPVATTIQLLVVLMSSVIIVMIAASKSSRDVMDDYVDRCAHEFTTVNRAAFIEAETDTDVVFGLAMEWVLVPVCVNLGLYVLGFLAYLFDSMSDQQAEFVCRSFPWEQGPMCIPNKDILARHVRIRAGKDEGDDFDAPPDLPPLEDNPHPRAAPMAAGAAPPGTPGSPYRGTPQPSVYYQQQQPPQYPQGAYSPEQEGDEVFFEDADGLVGLDGNSVYDPSAPAVATYDPGYAPGPSRSGLMAPPPPGEGDGEPQRHRRRKKKRRHAEGPPVESDGHGDTAMVPVG